MSAPLRQAEIDLDAYRANLERVRGWMRPVEVMAIMKADAYGHGLEPIALAAVDAGIRWIGVLTVPAALRLRAIGVGEDVHLFTWQHDPALDFRDAIDSAVDLGVSNVAELQRIVEAVDQRPARVHLGVDTGLHRDGSSIDDWPALVEPARDAQRAGRIEVVAAYTHLAESSDDDDRRFGDPVRGRDRARGGPRRRRPDGARGRVARRARTQGVPQGHGPDGGEPLRHPRRRRCLGGRPRARARDDGDGLGREDEARARRHRRLVRLHLPNRDETTLALVPFGYADGVPRSAQGRVEVAINGKRYPIAGRVAMDQFLVDVGDDDVQVGDTVVLFGTGERDEMTVLEWGAALDTIGEEIVCRIGARVHRVYSGHSVEGRVGEYLRGDHA